MFARLIPPSLEEAKNLLFYMPPVEELWAPYEPTAVRAQSKTVAALNRILLLGNRDLDRLMRWSFSFRSWGGYSPRPYKVNLLLSCAYHTPFEDIVPFAMDSRGRLHLAPRGEERAKIFYDIRGLPTIRPAERHKEYSRQFKRRNEPILLGGRESDLRYPSKDRYLWPWW